MGTILKYAFLGSLAGFGIMAYDFDFFLNAGGPTTSMTNSMNEVFGRDTLFILPTLGILAGTLFGSIIQIIKSLRRTR